MMARVNDEEVRATVRAFRRATCHDTCRAIAVELVKVRGDNRALRDELNRTMDRMLAREAQAP